MTRGCSRGRRAERELVAGGVLLARSRLRGPAQRRGGLTPSTNRDWCSTRRVLLLLHGVPRGTPFSFVSARNPGYDAVVVKTSFGVYV